MSCRAKTQDDHPWARLADAGETTEYHEQFLAYRDLGPSRTIDAAYSKYREAHPVEVRPGDRRVTRRASGQFQRHSKNFDWKRRSDAWDDHLQAAKDRAAVEYAGCWETRRLETIEKTWSMTEELATKLDKMLAFPLQTTKTSKDGKTIHVHPARWNLATIALIARTIAEMRAACLEAAIRPANEYAKGELFGMKAARDEFNLKLCPTAEIHATV